MVPRVDPKATLGPHGSQIGLTEITSLTPQNGQNMAFGVDLRGTTVVPPWYHVTHVVRGTTVVPHHDAEPCSLCRIYSGTQVLVFNTFKQSL